MSYLHIGNLYKECEVLLFKQVYAMEKIHGTSSHISWKDGELKFFAGGSNYNTFIALFDHEALKNAFLFLDYPEVTVYGEAYGGKCQGMAKTYGDKLRFVAFEVRIGDCWLKVPDAASVVSDLGLDFVHFRLIDATIEIIDAELLLDSVQAVKNGMGEGHKREGIVLRPMIELTKNNGERIIAKHKREDFQETKTRRNLDEDKLKVLDDAEKIAEEWVTMNRLEHVLDAYPLNLDIKETGHVITAMIEDIEREGEHEIVESRDARKSIGIRTAKLFKEKLKEGIK